MLGRIILARIQWLYSAACLAVAWLLWNVSTPGYELAGALMAASSLLSHLMRMRERRRIVVAMLRAVADSVDPDLVPTPDPRPAGAADAPAHDAPLRTAPSAD